MPSNEPTLKSIPPHDAPFEAINRFGHRFRAYDYWGSFEKCAEVAADESRRDLVALRTRLFFKLRALRHGGYEATPEELHELGDIVSAIRKEVEATQAAQRAAKGYDTNLAAEYYVMSVLHRLGAAASLTLGNKKGVDIMVARAAGDAVTVEVKGVAGPYDWPASNLASSAPERHYVALVTFDGSIHRVEHSPRCWVVPFPEIAPFMRQYKGRRNVSRAAITKAGARYLGSWHVIAGT